MDEKKSVKMLHPSMYARVNLGDDLVFTIQKVRIKMKRDLPYVSIKSLYFVLYFERNALLMRMQKLYDQVQSACRTIYCTTVRTSTAYQCTVYCTV